MSPLIAGVIGIGLLFLLFAAGMPIGFVMALVGLSGYVYLGSLDAGLNILGLTFYADGSSYTLSVIPLFILMGQFAAHSGLSRDIYYTVDKWLGHQLGGLAMATIGACAGFAAISGSSLATAATMGTVALPQMKKYRYSEALATGTVAAGGTLGILIPPSTTFVFYAILTEQSVGKLFIAGIFPGILLALLFILTIYIRVRFNPELAPRGARSNMKEKMVSLRGIWQLVVLFIVVMGGIYTGVFTPTEAAGVGAFGAFVFALAKKRINRENLFSSLGQTAQATGMIFIIVIGAHIFGFFLAVTRIPSELADFMATVEVSKYVILAAVVILYSILGMFLEGFAILVLTIPIIEPLMIGLGFDPIWFGVMIVIMMEMSLITPPVGINVFVLKGVAKDVPMYTIFRGILPFWVAMFICLIILSFFPQIATFLPDTMKGL
ncbi:MAG: TRAP transporter large permease [Deltaproteobacteria bacterium]|nr:TRAP transporter large permease [Deltaproteobacteria bacterium]